MQLHAKHITKNKNIKSITDFIKCDEQWNEQDKKDDQDEQDEQDEHYDQDEKDDDNDTDDDSNSIDSDEIDNYLNNKYNKIYVYDVETNTFIKHFTNNASDDYLLVHNKNIYHF